MSPTITEEVVSERWSTLFVIAVVLLGLCAFWPVVPWTYSVWVDGLLGGGAAALMAAPIALVITKLTIKYTRINHHAHRTHRAYLSLLLVAGGLILSLSYARSDSDRLIWTGSLMPPFIWICVWGRYGWQWARVLTLPIGFLYFALPWEYFLRPNFEPILQGWTTDVAMHVLKTLQYDVWYHNAYTIDSKRYYLIVNETCSGINLLMTLFMYTLIFGWFAQPRLLGRLLLLCAVFPLALLANGLRVTTIFLLGHYGGVEWADGFWHTGSAYLLFIPVFWILYLINTVVLRGLPSATKPRNDSQDQGE